MMPWEYFTFGLHWQLQTTALAHEAYLKLLDQSRIEWRNRAQFFAVARRILVAWTGTDVRVASAL